MPSPDKPREALKLDSLQRDVLVPQIQAFLDATQDPSAREVYTSLLESVRAMEVAPDLQPRLGAIVEVALSSGRIRKLFGPGAELSMVSLFQKTPRGIEIADSIRSVNAALAKLKDQPLEQATATLRAPGAYALTLKTAGVELILRFEPTGVRIESVDVNLE